MKYELPVPVRTSLANRGHRLHHVLWHVVRDSWHAFTPQQQALFRQRHPGWTPNHPRFVRVPVTPQNPNGLQVNMAAGESFLFMHRQMILAVNAQLLALGEPALVPWISLPAPTDPDYPVPGRTVGGNPTQDVKSDGFGQQLAADAASILVPQVLRQRSLAFVGAWVESFVHDFMHMRWADTSSGAMAQFPPLDPTNINPTIGAQFDAPAVDWLGHPWSSHVNSVFWKLHGWIDQVIEAWRIARGLATITWSDTWTGDMPPGGGHSHLLADNAASRLKALHEHIDHGHHGDAQLLAVFKTLNSFPGCHVGFDYVLTQRIPKPTLDVLPE